MLLTPFKAHLVTKLKKERLVLDCCPDSLWNTGGVCQSKNPPGCHSKLPYEKQGMEPEQKAQTSGLELKVLTAKSIVSFQMCVADLDLTGAELGGCKGVSWGGKTFVQYEDIKTQVIMKNFNRHCPSLKHGSQFSSLSKPIIPIEV